MSSLHSRRIALFKKAVAVLNLVLMLAVAASCLPAVTPEPVGARDGAASVSPTASTTPTTAPSMATPQPVVIASRTRGIATRAASLSPATATPSRTPSRTPRATATPSRTVTATATPSRTPKPTITPSSTATHALPVPSLLPTQTVTPTLTPSITPTPAQSPTPVATAAFDEDVLNILLIGLDSTANLRAQNTDVMIVVSVNTKTRTVSMLSIPRDLWVYIPTYGWSRINTAHRRGYIIKYPGEGPALLMRTIEQNLGVTTHHWARVDFGGFEQVVDELGGVDMTVSCPVNLRYVKPQSDQEEEMILQPGVYHMDGNMALRYVRTRRGGSDFDRARRQQQFLRSMWKQFKSPDLLLKIPGLYSALKGSVTTDLSLGDLISLARVGISIRPQAVRSFYIGANETDDWITADGWMVLLPNQEKIQQVVARFSAPPVTTAADEAASEGAVIHVLNGTAKPLMTTFAVDQLQWNGLKVAATGEAARTNYAKTQIVVFEDRPKAVQMLSSVLKVKPENIVYQPDSDQPADIQVILGADYDPCK